MDGLQLCARLKKQTHLLMHLLKTIYLVKLVFYFFLDYVIFIIILGVIVVDEIHMIFENERGSLLENIICKILYASMKKGLVFFCKII